MLQTPQSVRRWALPLRPIRHTLSLTSEHLPRWLAALAGPPAAAVDHLAARIPRSPFGYTAPISWLKS